MFWVKKKELLKMSKLLVTPKMKELVREDIPKEKIYRRWYSKYTRITCERYQYYRAKVENGILKVAIFSGKLIATGHSEPEYEIYISKQDDEYLTLETATGSWKTARIDRLTYEIYDGYLEGNKPWYEQNTKKVVNEYLGTGNLEIKDAILKYQNELLGEKLKKRHRSETEKIDAVMNAVPDLPKDFDNWVINSAFIKERYVFYYAGTKKGYCTHCKKEVELKKKPVHNQEGICPHCRSKVVLKAYKKQKYIEDTKNVGIIQKLTDDTGYVLRRFRVQLKRTLEKKWDIEFGGCWEMSRIVTDNNLYECSRYIWDDYKNTGVYRWCQEHVYSNYYYSSDCILYYRNIKKLRKEWDLQYVPMEEVLKREQGHYCTPLRMIRNLKREPKLEYLIKAGLYRLVWNITEDTCAAEFDWSARKPWDVLGITKEQMQQCIKLNVSYRQILTMKRAAAQGIKLTDAQLIYFTHNAGPELIGKIAVYGHMEKFKKYFEKELKSAREIGDYFDYLEDLKFLKMPINKNTLFPKGFQTIHGELAQQRREKEDALKKMEICEKDKILQEMLPELKEIYKGENEEFVIVLPTCKEDFNREGRENNNCVGGSYYDKMLNGKCVVMFLRKKEDPEKAFCTVEMDGSRIVQCRAIRNSVAPAEATLFMEKFSKEVRKRIEKKEKQIAIAV